MYRSEVNIIKKLVQRVKLVAPPRLRKAPHLNSLAPHLVVDELPVINQNCKPVTIICLK